MTTNPTPTTRDPEPVKATKPARSQSILMHADDGARLRVLALYRSNGTATTCVIHTTKAASGKLVNSRGATQQHATAEAARAAIERLAAEAAKTGWQRSTRAAGFAAKPDAFDAEHLPAPKLVPKKKR